MPLDTVARGTAAELVHPDQTVDDGVVGAQQQDPLASVPGDQVAVGVGWAADEVTGGARVDLKAGAVLIGRQGSQGVQANEVTEHLGPSGARLIQDGGGTEPIERQALDHGARGGDVQADGGTAGGRSDLHA